MRPTVAAMKRLEAEVARLKFDASDIAARARRLERLLLRAGACLANGGADEEDAVMRDLFLELIGNGDTSFGSMLAKLTPDYSITKLPWPAEKR